MSPNPIHILRQGLIGFIFAIGMICIALSSKADQSGDWTYTSDGTNVTITGYTGTNLDVSIPDTITNMSVVAVGDWAFSNKTTMTGVSFPSTLSTIGAWAFLNCYSLQSITIPSNVTNVGAYAFINCVGLTTLVFSNGITSLRDFCFFTCTSLTNITIPASVSFIGTAVFANEPNLLTITVDPSNQFYSTTNDILFDKSLTTLIQCPSAKTSGLTIPASVVNVGDFSFGSCFKLTNMTIPDGVTNIGQYAFYSCSSLTNMVVPASVVTIGSNAFSWATHLTNIVFNGNPPSITLPVFDWDNNLTVYYYPWTSGWTGTFGGRPTVPMDISYAVNNGTVTITGYTGTNSTLFIPDVIFNMPVVAIGRNAFRNCSNLVSVAIPETVRDIGIDSFSYCTSLADIVIPPNVTNIDAAAFYVCNSLTSIDIPDSVNNIGWAAFAYCAILTNIHIGSGVNTLYGRAFSYCPLLTSITVSEQNPLLTSLDGVLFAKDLSDLVLYPEGRGGSYSVPQGVQEIGIEAFSCCIGLTNITFPNSVQLFNVWAINSCSNLTSIIFKGDQPPIYDTPFDANPLLTVYYYPWTSGWTGSFGGVLTQVNPAYTQWLTNYGLSTNLSDDADHDGMLNWQEYLAGTNPTNDADRLAISSMGSGSNAQITWWAKSNVSYQVMKSLNLMGAWANASSGSGTNQQAFQTAPVDGLLQYADPDYAGATNGFYRVNVVP